MQLDVECGTQAASTASLLGEPAPVETPKPVEPKESPTSEKNVGAKGRKEGKGLRHKVQCRGCRKPIDAALMTERSVFCPMLCKKSLDRLAYLAKQEGPEAVKKLSETRSDATAVFKLLKAYHAQVPPPKPGGRAGKGGEKFAVLNYFEESRASTGVVSDSVGRYMWRGSFIEFKTSADGGYRSRPQAEREWLELVESVKANPEKHLWDNQGPCEEDCKGVRNAQALRQKRKKSDCVFFGFACRVLGRCEPDLEFLGCRNLLSCGFPPAGTLSSVGEDWQGGAVQKCIRTDQGCAEDGAFHETTWRR